MDKCSRPMDESTRNANYSSTYLHELEYSFYVNHKHSRRRSPPNTQALEKEYLGEASYVEPKKSFSRGAYSLRIYPNGEFGIGRIPLAKKTSEEKRFDKRQVGGFQYGDVPRCHELEDGTKLLDGGDTYEGVLHKLGSAHESSQEKKKYGLKGITSYGRKVVRNLAYLMEKRKGRHKVAMGTLTLPSFTDSQMRVIATKWAYLTSRFFQECKRKYEKYGKRFRYVSVTEVQPKRWKARGEVGLHIHFLFEPTYIYSIQEWAMPDNWIRETWQRLLSNILSSEQVVPYPNYRRDMIEVSAAAYMGKYMSKGADMIADIIEQKGVSVIPSQWWSADSVSKKELRSKIISISDSRTQIALYLCRNPCDNFCHYVSPVTIETPVNGERIIGYFGRFKMFAIELIVHADVCVDVCI